MFQSKRELADRKAEYEKVKADAVMTAATPMSDIQSNNQSHLQSVSDLARAVLGQNTASIKEEAAERTAKRQKKD